MPQRVGVYGRDFLLSESCTNQELLEESGEAIRVPGTAEFVCKHPISFQCCGCVLLPAFGTSSILNGSTD